MDGKIILLNGHIASGKNTIGKALVDRLIKDGYPAEFLDLDQEVSSIAPNWSTEDDELKSRHWHEARKNLADRSNHLLQAGVTPVVVGPFFFEEEITGITKHIDLGAEIYLFALTAPLQLRLDRAKARNPKQKEQELIDQHTRVQEMRLESVNAIENTGDIEQTMENILEAIEQNLGRL